MKKLLGFAIFVGTLWFCHFSFQTIDARDSRKLSERLEDYQRQVWEKDGKIEELTELLTRFPVKDEEKEVFRAKLIEAGVLSADKSDEPEEVKNAGD